MIRLSVFPVSGPLLCPLTWTHCLCVCVFVCLEVTFWSPSVRLPFFPVKVVTNSLECGKKTEVFIWVIFTHWYKLDVKISQTREWRIQPLSLENIPLTWTQKENHSSDLALVFYGVLCPIISLSVPPAQGASWWNLLSYVDKLNSGWLLLCCYPSSSLSIWGLMSLPWK